MKKVLVVLGTRPEMIKLVTVILALKADPRTQPVVCITGQHREMVDQLLALSNIVPDEDLDIMQPNQTLTDITTRVLSAMPALFEKHQPDVVMVQGDTSTVFAASLGAFYAGIDCAHVEAGLRSGNMYAPWPEEFNRCAVSLTARYHFAPTAQSAQHLVDEKVNPNHIITTGNTVVDALHYYRKLLNENAELGTACQQQFSRLDASKKWILATSHRRENHDGGIENICNALATLAARDDVQIILPVHPNPNVRNVVHDMLGTQPNILLTEPLDYFTFLYAMDKAHLIISDSGGVQEEAPALQKPVLVLRDTTERPEGVQAGVAKLVGTDTANIIAEATTLLDDPAAYAAMQGAQHLYGDGNASQRIVEELCKN